MKSRRAAYLVYLSLITALGAAVVAFSAYRIAADRVSYPWLILAYLTILTGAFTLQLPGVNSKFSVSDMLIFVNTILFGTAAGALTAALDGCLASLRFETPSRRMRATPFNTSVMSLSAFAAGEVFFAQFGRNPLSQESTLGIPELILPLVLSALVYYLCNTALVAGMIALDSGGNMLRIWQEAFLRTSVIVWASAAAGALLAFIIRPYTPLTLLFAVLILVSIYFVDKIYIGPEAGPPVPADNDPVALRPAYRRYHYFMVILGLGFILLLLIDVIEKSISLQWLIVAALTIGAGFVTVCIPGIKIKLTIADTFVFVNTILFGPVVGGITAALDGLAGSLRCKTKSRRLEFTLFNMAAMSLSAYLAGEIFFRILNQGPLHQAEKVNLAAMLLPALALAVAYYIFNALGVSFIVALQAQVSVWRIWRENLVWSLATYIACAFGAVFIAAGMLAVTASTTLAILILLAAVYLTCKAWAGRVSNTPSA